MNYKAESNVETVDHAKLVTGAQLLVQKPVQGKLPFTFDIDDGQ